MPTDYNRQLQQGLATACGCGASADRIQGLMTMADPRTGRVLLQFDVLPGPGVSSDDIVRQLADRVASKTLTLTDAFNNMLNVNCYDPPTPIYPWTDYGPCPYQPCAKNGKCKVKPAGQYYCECPPPYMGQNCDQMKEEESKSNNNLLWLLAIPVAAALLALALGCLCCWCRGCCCFAGGAGQPKVIEIIEDDVYQDLDNRSLRSVHSCRSCASQPPIYSGAPSMMMSDPGSTYYHALGRPFAVAFNDNTFNAVGYATNESALYGIPGVKRSRSICGDEEIQVVMNRRGSCCDSDFGGYHSAGMGNKYAVAYNGRTFNTYSSMPHYDRVRSYN